MSRRPALVLVLVLAACGGDPAPPSIPLAELRAEETRALCAYYVRCGVFDTAETCAAFFPVPDDRSLIAAVEAGKIRYDGAAALRCQEEMAARSCDATLLEGRVPLVCAEIFEGQVAAGGSCGFDLECSSSFCLLPACPPGACCPGACEPGERNPAGSPCQSDLQCVAETFCGPDRTCTPLLAAGEPCKSDVQCQYGLGCVGKTALMDGMCAALPALGEPCPDDRCADIGARCDASQTCVAVGLAGAPCTADADCSEFLQCSAEGMCEDVPAVGQPCTDRCAADAYCAAGTCAAPQPDGAFCELPQQCDGLICLEGEFANQCATKPVCF